jgi:transitional endoplasmic reticulum ATPase
MIFKNPIARKEENLTDNSSICSLKVLEQYTVYCEQGIACIDSYNMNLFGISKGDFIEISGRKKTVTKCAPLHTSDLAEDVISTDMSDKKKRIAKCSPHHASHIKKDIIRMDALVRINAGVEIGETATIRKAKIIPAEKVIVVSFENIPSLDPQYFHDNLLGRAMIKDDIFTIPYFAGRLGFQVIDTIPATNAVLVTQKTVFLITKKQNSE